MDTSGLIVGLRATNSDESTTGVGRKPLHGVGESCRWLIVVAKDDRHPGRPTDERPLQRWSIQRAELERRQPVFMSRPNYEKFDVRERVDHLVRKAFDALQSFS